MLWLSSNKFSWMIYMYVYNPEILKDTILQGKVSQNEWSSEWSSDGSEKK